MLATIKFMYGGLPAKAVLGGNPLKWSAECERVEAKFTVETLLNDLFDPLDYDNSPAAGAFGAEAASKAAEFFKGKLELPQYQDAPGRIY